MLCNHLKRGLLSAAVAVSLNAQAAEWVAEPYINLSGEYNDNLRLTNTDQTKVWSAVIDPRLRLARHTELLNLDANARLRSAFYSGEDGLDTNDSFFDVAARRRFQRGSLNASASMANDTTLQNETLDLDTGLVVNQVDRTQKRFRVAGQHMFTETVWVEASMNYSTVAYDDGERFGLLDYDYLNPSLQLIHQLDPKIQVFGILGHARVSYDTASELESNTDNLQLGGSYNFTETWTMSGSIGSRRTRTSSIVSSAVPRAGFEILFPLIFDVVNQPRDSESTGLVYNATITHTLETGDLHLNASRSVTPSSTGTDTDTTSITLAGNHRFSSKLSVRLAVSYLQSETVGGTRTAADNERYRLSPGLTWRLDRDMTLNAGYNYTRVNRNNTASNDAESNAAFISLGYTWPRAAISR